jgi:hypothetical protein
MENMMIPHAPSREIGDCRDWSRRETHPGRLAHADVLFRPVHVWPDTFPNAFTRISYVERTENARVCTRLDAHERKCARTSAVLRFSSFARMRASAREILALD